MNLLEILKEQETFGFTGRVNILDKNSGQFLGVIFQEEGVIVSALYLEVRGKKALYKVIMDEMSKDSSLRYVIEPEVVEDADRSFNLNVKEFEEKCRDFYEKVESSKKLRPPDRLKIALDPDFISKGQEVDYNEFELMYTISDYARVRDIYENCDLFEFEITSSIVSLRKKGALRVVGK